MHAQTAPGKSLPFSQWCEMRGFSRATGYRLIRDGEVCTFKVRGNRYITERADREFVARKEQEATA